MHGRTHQLLDEVSVPAAGLFFGFSTGGGGTLANVLVEFSIFICDISLDI
jgi:hypothetical protein